MPHLEKFLERIEFVLIAIPATHRPTEVTKFTWLFSRRVKKCKLLQRHIDRIRDARETSHCRSWEWLMNKIKAVLVEVREDANEEPIRTSLLSKAKPTPAPKAAVAQGADGGRKETKGLPNRRSSSFTWKSFRQGEGGGVNKGRNKGFSWFFWRSAPVTADLVYGSLQNNLPGMDMPCLEWTCLLFPRKRSSRSSLVLYASMPQTR